MENHVFAHNKQFEGYISKEKIDRRVEEIGKRIREKFKNKNPVFLGILNGSFIFAADLIRSARIDCEISFIKLSSYKGMMSSGTVTELFGIDIDIQGRHLIIVEDIVDSGRTMTHLIGHLKSLGAASIYIVTLLLKREMLEYEIPLDEIGFEIPNKFVIGYGLDYEGVGRNLESIYQLAESENNF